MLSVEWALSHMERFVARHAQVALDYDALSTLRATVLAQQTTNSKNAPCVHEWESGMFSHICKKCGLVDDA